MESKKVTIGIDASPVARNFISGTERYTIEIIKALSLLDIEREYLLYTPKPLPVEFMRELGSNFKERVIAFPRFWIQGRLVMELMMHPPDIFFVPANAMPWYSSKKTVSVIQDVGFEQYRENYSKFQFLYLRYSTEHALKKATRIVVPSQATKDEIRKYYPWADLNKIRVIHAGLTKIKEGSCKNLVPLPFILVVGRLEVRKNIFRILAAFESVKTRFPSLKLAFSGRPGMGAEQFKKKVRNSKYKEDIFIFNSTSEQDLALLYKKAEILVFPSLYEGFGLPILEAFEFNLPVITSNVTATAEVAGDGALLVNPTSISEIARAVSRILSDKTYTKELNLRGQKRLLGFTWKKTAREFLGIFSDLLG